MPCNNLSSNCQFQRKVVQSMNQIKKIGRSSFGVFFIVAKLFVIYVKV